MKGSRKARGGPPSLKVLVVEDEALIAILVEDMITELGHEVVGPVGRLAEAMDIARSEIAVDCAILDVNIKGRDTYALAAALTERHIPFIFATGYAREKLAAGFRDAPMLQKPFQVSDLRAAFDHLNEPRHA
ncbi:MAG: response regulator [Caulobacteraceae bacterium]